MALPGKDRGTDDETSGAESQPFSKLELYPEVLLPATHLQGTQPHGAVIKNASCCSDISSISMQITEFH